MIKSRYGASVCPVNIGVTVNDVKVVMIAACSLDGSPIFQHADRCKVLSELINCLDRV